MMNPLMVIGIVSPVVEVAVEVTVTVGEDEAADVGLDAGLDAGDPDMVKPPVKAGRVTTVMKPLTVNVY